MKVEVISYSQPAVHFAENMTELVAFCARVSNPSNQTNKDTSEKLIKYLKFLILVSIFFFSFLSCSSPKAAEISEGRKL